MDISVAFQAVFDNWTALQLAVEHKLGGPQSKEIAQWMVTTVVDFFKENGNVIPEEASDYVGDMLNNEFNTLCEDGSLEEVGERLCRFYRLIQTGQLEEITAELKTFKGSGVQECKKQSTPNNEDVVSPMNNLTVDEQSPRHPRNEPDEDGWITVTKGKK